MECDNINCNTNCSGHCGKDSSIEYYDYIKPSHYTLWKDNKDTFFVIQRTLTEEEFRGFIKGSILSYQLRLGKKPGESAEKDQAKIKEYQEIFKNL